jgi:hypothetical protein
MPSPESFHSARLMGAWVIDMTDVELAHAAVALCRSRTGAKLEVRHTLWGVQVRTDSQDIAELLAHRYAGPTAAALAA